MPKYTDTFTADDVEAACEAYEDGWGELGYGETTLEINGVERVVKAVEHFGGGEGCGEETYVVLEIEGRLFKKDGYYASHYGTDWDGNFNEVVAYEKTVKAYKRA